ncbi:MAG: FAD-dependent oxidoreductase, partial [Betaproteobacteria bacterium]
MKITRRDFLNGATFAAGSALIPDLVTASNASLNATEYPPLKSGLRGSHPGAFEVAHAMRDGSKPGANIVRSTGEHYDLVIVGAGISGLSAAYLYRKRKGPGARILVLDNHDDFGGHAKRNEFKISGKTLLGYGGTQNIEVL